MNETMSSGSFALISEIMPAIKNNDELNNNLVPIINSFLFKINILPLLTYYYLRIIELLTK